MMAIGKAQTAMMRDKSKLQLVAKMARRVSAVGVKLRDKKFTEACADYDSIAGDFGIDLKAQGEQIVKMKDIKKDGGRNGGICSQAQASKVHMSLTNEIEARAKAGNIKQDELKRYFADTDELGELMYTDPSSVCSKLQLIAKRYNLPFSIPTA